MLDRRKFFKAAFFLILIWDTGWIFCQEADLASRFEARQYKDEAGNILLYRLLKPKTLDGQNKYPLVLFLHGIGERGNDNEAQLKWGAKNFAIDENMANYPCFVAVPQCPLDDFWVSALQDLSSSYSMTEKPTEAMRMALELVDVLQGEFPQIDPQRIYVTGLSMGGFGTWDAVQRRPDLFAAAVPVCGGGDVTKAERIARLPIWDFHGAEDRLVIPKWSRDMIDAIREAGGSPKYTEYPGIGHQSWIKAYSDPELFKWLFSQKKRRTGQSNDTGS
jgi:predicted peptidase